MDVPNPNIQCPVCLEQCSPDPNDLNSPGTLPCGHKFCLECLRKLSKELIRFSCPLCKKLISLDELTTNRWLMHIIDSYAQHKQEMINQFQNTIKQLKEEIGKENQNVYLLEVVLEKRNMDVISINEVKIKVLEAARNGLEKIKNKDTLMFLNREEYKKLDKKLEICLNKLTIYRWLIHIIDSYAQHKREMINQYQNTINKLQEEIGKEIQKNLKPLKVALDKLNMHNISLFAVKNKVLEVIDGLKKIKNQDIQLFFNLDEYKKLENYLNELTTNEEFYKKQLELVERRYKKLKAIENEFKQTDNIQKLVDFHIYISQLKEYVKEILEDDRIKKDPEGLSTINDIEEKIMNAYFIPVDSSLTSQYPYAIGEIEQPGYNHLEEVRDAFKLMFYTSIYQPMYTSQQTRYQATRLFHGP